MLPPVSTELITVDHFDLASTCAPASWGKGQWPDTAWLDNSFCWCGWESSSLVFRQMRQLSADTIQVRSEGSTSSLSEWFKRVVGIGRTLPEFSDHRIASLAASYPGMRLLSEGSLFIGLIDCIVGQSISVAAAAVTQTRLAALFHPGVERCGRVFVPAPRADDLADAPVDLVFTTGVTRKRAEALVSIARAEAEHRLPTDEQAWNAPDETRRILADLPQVGPWTVESALLWGLGMPDAWPTGDVALLRAAKRTWEDESLTLRDLDRLSEAWRPHRAWASRLLWTDLLGTADSPA